MDALFKSQRSFVVEKGPSDESTHGQLFATTKLCLLVALDLLHHGHPAALIDK
jgi:hypothetical protein